MRAQGSDVGRGVGGASWSPVRMFPGGLGKHTVWQGWGAAGACEVGGAPWIVIRGAASERRGNILNDFKDQYLTAKARIWP